MYWEQCQRRILLPWRKSNQMNLEQYTEHITTSLPLKTFWFGLAYSNSVEGIISRKCRSCYVFRWRITYPTNENRTHLLIPHTGKTSSSSKHLPTLLGSATFSRHSNYSPHFPTSCWRNEEALYSSILKHKAFSFNSLHAHFLFQIKWITRLSLVCVYVNGSVRNMT